MRRTLTIEDMRAIAAEHGGKCLSQHYGNAHTKLSWRCAQGHEWDAVPNSIKDRRTWCPRCAGIVRHSLEEMRELAAKQGGDCLSTTYLNNRTKLNWQCAEGHQWEARPAAVLKGQWCPQCARKKRAAPVFRSLADMRHLARQHGGRCLSQEFLGIGTKLLWECAEGHQWEAPPRNLLHSHSWCPVCAGNRRLSLDEMRRIAARSGGKCLSRTYVNSTHPLKWACHRGHTWMAIPESVKRGSWCPECQGVAKGSIAKMQQLARRHNGQCLSDVYLGAHEYLEWQCQAGHRWLATPGSVASGRWCAACQGRKKGTIEEMRELARQRGGTCLSSRYTNNKTRLKWQCRKGHTWMAPSNYVVCGNWCPHCAGNVRRTLADMVRLAKKRGGRCLSKQYVNNHTKLEWQCAQGHVWPASPDKVSAGRWCPFCAKQRAPMP